MRVLALSTLLLFGCRSHAPERASSVVVASATDASLGAVDAEPPTPALPDVATDWCLDGWKGLDESTCYVVPDGPHPRSLLVYFAGIVPPVPRSPQKEKVAHVVAATASRARAVALLPRGLRGIGPANAKDWWAWPTSPADFDAHAPAIVAGVLAARARLERSLGRFDRTYVAGSSSGAYFLSALALSGTMDADGWAAASGGSVASASPRARKVPFYVGYASGDPTSSGPKELGAFLSRSGWPVKVAEHPGDHGAREVYLDEAFAFWEAR